MDKEKTNENLVNNSNQQEETLIINELKINKMKTNTILPYGKKQPFKIKKQSESILSDIRNRGLFGILFPKRLIKHCLEFESWIDTHEDLILFKGWSSHDISYHICRRNNKQLPTKEERKKSRIYIKPHINKHGHPDHGEYWTPIIQVFPLGKKRGFIFKDERINSPYKFGGNRSENIIKTFEELKGLIYTNYGVRPLTLLQYNKNVKSLEFNKELQVWELKDYEKKIIKTFNSQEINDYLTEITTR